MLRGLDEEHFFAAGLRAAAEHVVGAFEGFDGDHRALGGDDGLTDVEPGHLAGHARAEFELVVADAAGPAGHAAWRGEVVLEKDARIEHADADFLDLDGDGAEDRLGVAFLEGGHQRDELQIRNHAREQFARGDLAGHHGAGGTEFLEGVEHLAELADGDGAMVGGGEGGDEGRVGLFFKGDQLYLGAATAGAFDEEGGVAAFAGDDRHGLRGVEARGEESRG